MKDQVSTNKTKYIPMIQTFKKDWLDEFKEGDTVILVDGNGKHHTHEVKLIKQAVLVKKLVHLL